MELSGARSGQDYWREGGQAAERLAKDGRLFLMNTEVVVLVVVEEAVVVVEAQQMCRYGEEADKCSSVGRSNVSPSENSFSLN